MKCNKNENKHVKYCVNKESIIVYLPNLQQLTIKKTVYSADQTFFEQKMKELINENILLLFDQYGKNNGLAQQIDVK